MEIQMQNVEAVGLEQIRAFPLTRAVCWFAAKPPGL